MAGDLRCLTRPLPFPADRRSTSRWGETARNRQGARVAFTFRCLDSCVNRAKPRHSRWLRAGCRHGATGARAEIEEPDNLVVGIKSQGLLYAGIVGGPARFPHRAEALGVSGENDCLRRRPNRNHLFDFWNFVRLHRVSGYHHDDGRAHCFIAFSLKGIRTCIRLCAAQRIGQDFAECGAAILRDYHETPRAKAAVIRTADGGLKDAVECRLVRSRRLQLQG
jgi:hypothetical protein